ncbi:MAG: prepilin peptidase [Phycisphaerae bacterium]|nr:prepilin peptidase [Phycisphaerae bacterium]
MIAQSVGVIAQYWYVAVAAVVAGSAGVTDVRSGRIYNVVTYPGIAVGLIGHTLAGQLGGGDYGLGLLGALTGAALGATMLLAWLAGGIGGGDAKLMIAIGALTGWQFALGTMFWGFLAAAVMAVGVMLHRGILRSTLARLGRYVYVSLTPHKAADPTTDESPKIPLGLALLIGWVVTLGEWLIWGRPLLQRAVEG